MLQAPVITTEATQRGKIMTAADVLRHKGTEVITVSPEDSVQEAIQTLVNNGVGSLLVVDELKNIVGILSERDILRASAKGLERLRELTVSDLMTREVIIGLMDDSLDYIMDLITEKRIRHLPIMDRGRLAGILSIGDVVKTKARLAEVDIRYLTDYITGIYPA